MDNQKYIKKLTLSCNVIELQRITEALEELIAERNIPVKTGLTINLAVEEAFTNIVNYAFSDNQPHYIDVIIEYNNGEVATTLIDDGQAYDPTSKEDPPIDTAIEDRQIGGLGIFLIKKLMDKVEYTRASNKNHLKLIKIISK